MIFILNIAQIIISILLVVMVLLQQRGGGLSPVFGGGGGSFGTRRGIEKIIYQATIVLAVFFLVTAVANVYLRGQLMPSEILDPLAATDGLSTSTMTTTTPIDLDSTDDTAIDAIIDTAPLDTEDAE